MMPLCVSAAVASFQELLSAIGSLISLLIPIAVASALLFFFYGLAEFIRNSGNEKKVEEGRRIMIWGVIALFVMSSIWGIVGFFQLDIFGVAGVPQLLVP